MLIMKSDALRVPIDIELKEGLNVLSGDSGEGKTFMFSLVQAYCLKNKLKCALVNSSNFTLSQNTGYADSEPLDILLLDNLDLYFSPEFLKNCYARCKYILCSLKRYPKDVTIPMHSCQFTPSKTLLKVRSADVFLF